MFKLRGGQYPSGSTLGSQTVSAAADDTGAPSKVEPERASVTMSSCAVATSLRFKGRLRTTTRIFGWSATSTDRERTRGAAVAAAGLAVPGCRGAS